MVEISERTKNGFMMVLKYKLLISLTIWGCFLIIMENLMKRRNMLHNRGEKLILLNSKVTISMFKLNALFLILMLIVYSVIVLKYGGFIKPRMWRKFILIFARKYSELKSTRNSLVYYELGRLPLYILRKLRIIKYWGKLKNTENCILKSLNDNWVNVINIKTELCKLGLAYIWDEMYIDKRLYKII